MADPPAPWYADGLRFACQGCGACCRIEGHVWVDEAAIRRLAGHLELPVAEFARRYVRRVGRRRSLVEKPNHDCVFWDGGCTVYPARPKQCRTFPFWSEFLEDPDDWAVTATECRGIGHGRLYAAGEIRAIAAGREATAEGPAEGCGCGHR